MKYSSIGSYIRILRVNCGLTQKALADRLHVTDKAVSKWERDLSYPDIRLLPSLAEALNVSMSDLISVFGNEGSPSELMEHYKNSPDLRTPLHIILGCTDLLETYHDDPERFARYLEAIRVSGKYLLSALKVSDRAPEAYDFHGRRILIAEDNDINREIVNEILKHSTTE